MMYATTRIWVAAGLAAATLAGCATAPPQETAAAEPEERVCMQANRLRGFDALSDRYIHVRESRDKHYLLTMRSHCFDLRNAVTIAVSDTTNRICSNSFGKILYRDGLGGRLNSCLIGEIVSVSSKEHARAIVKARTGPPGKEEQGTWEELPPEQQ